MTFPERRRRGAPRELLGIVLVALAVGLAFQGSRGLYESTEGRYAEVGREMLETGEWWVPQLDYQPHWTKPPVTYWAIAGGIALLGPDAWGVRLVSALAFPLLALTVVWLGARLWDLREGVLAGVVYATSLFPVVAASTISTDLLLALWEAVAVAAYWEALRGREAHRRRWIRLMWAAFGLAFLTKGPPALLSLAALVAFGLMARRRGWDRPRLADPLGLGIFVVLGLGWYLAVVVETPGLLDYFLGQEVVARVATDQFGRNPEWYKPFVVYLPPLLLGLGGWLGAAGAVRRARGPSWIRRTTGDPAGVFLLVWLALPLLVLSISRSRLPMYVLPFFPVVALAWGRGLASLPQESFWIRRRWMVASALGLVLVAVKGTSARVVSDKDMARLEAAVEEVLPPGGRVAVVDEDGLFGLQFYRHGDLTRLDSGRADPSQIPSGPLLVLVRPDGSLPPGLCSPRGASCVEAGTRVGFRMVVRPGGVGE